MLNEKHLYSILLWLENNTPNEYNNEISKYVEIRYYSFVDEIINKNFLNNNFYFNTSFYSKVVRSLLLYNYSGVWFDLDCFILRNFDPIFFNFENEICVYNWETQNYPNNAIYISLEPKSEKMKKILNL